MFPYGGCNMTLICVGCDLHPDIEWFLYHIFQLILGLGIVDVAAFD